MTSTTQRTDHSAPVAETDRTATSSRLFTTPTAGQLRRHRMPGHLVKTDADEHDVATVQVDAMAAGRTSGTCCTPTAATSGVSLARSCCPAMSGSATRRIRLRQRTSPQHLARRVPISQSSNCRCRMTPPCRPRWPMP